MATRNGVAHRYPRPGSRIAPATLSLVLAEPSPDYLVAGTGAQGLPLADLDETVWEQLPGETIAELAEIVVSRVSASGARRLYRERPFPRPPQGLKLEDLALEHRTRLCLAREGLDRQPERLGAMTLGQVLAIRAFGPRCLVDLLSAVEGVLSQGSGLDRRLTRAAQRLADLPEAARVGRDDPRFGRTIREWDMRARTARQAAEGMAVRSQDPPDPAYVATQVEQLLARLGSASRCVLEQELTEIFASTPHQRNREIVIGYYGWADGESHTLAEIGARWGMTRERTRQICAKLVKHASPSQIFAPVMDRVLEFLQGQLPSAVGALERAMREAGLTAVGLRLENVEVAAKLLGRKLPLATVAAGRERLAVHSSQLAVPGAAMVAAKKEVYYHGASTIERIVQLLSGRFGTLVDGAIVAETLQGVEGFCWLDRASGWFRLRSVSKHGLPMVIDKVLAVAPRIRLCDLQGALMRNRRMWKTAPPEAMLREYCRQMPGIRVEGDWIISETPHQWDQSLRGVEAQLVRILRQHGPILERGVLEDLCVTDGMNRFSFHAFLASSPVIAQYGHSVYGLLGAEVTPGQVKSIVAGRRAQRPMMRVLDSHGRTPDGRIWLRYRLSKAASNYAVVTVPAALKRVVAGKFDLMARDGSRVGVLAAKDGRAWGLGSYLRKRGAQTDDRVVVTLDLQRRKAVIALNGGAARRS